MDPRPAGYPGSGWPTENVVTAAQDGDSAAVAALVSGSLPHVRRYARSLCATPEDAEDAAQEALIVLYRRIGSLRATGALSSWMFSIVRHECLRRLRRSGRLTPWIEEPAPSAEEALLTRLETERLLDAIAALPPELRSVLVLRDIQGYSGATAAEVLGLSRTAMKSRLHRARQRIRTALLVA